MKNSLIVKILTYLTVLILLVFILVSYYLKQEDIKIIKEIKDFNYNTSFFNIETIQESQLEKTKENMKLLIKNIALSSAIFLANYAKKELIKTIQIYMTQKELKAIVIRDNDLNRFFLVTYKKNNEIHFAEFIPNEFRNYKIITKAITYEIKGKEQVIGSVSLYYDENIILDKIQMIKENSFNKIENLNKEVNKKINNSFKSKIYFLSLFFILLLLLLSLLIIYYVRQPLRKVNYGLYTFFRYLNNEVTQIEKIDINRNDEFGKMAKYLNKNIEISARLHLKINELNLTLEEKVKTKTEELRLLNESLELKVHEEVQKNMQKDNLLYQQSKLAAMGEMIGNIAHQWRQPLNALGLVLQSFNFFYKQNKLNDKIVYEQTSKAKLLISQMSSTIDDFRNFFNPNKEKVVFSIDDSIKNVLSLVHGTYEANKINIIKDLNCNIELNSYQGEFEQVLLNILQNAKDAFVLNNKDLKEIKIQTFFKDNKILIKIYDNAGGIEHKLLNRIFEPYFTTKNEGTGIGLYMSKQIIQEHMHGDLVAKNISYIKNKIKSNGVCFSIELDLHKV